jgi:small subunit ribosomal protein S20
LEFIYLDCGFCECYKTDAQTIIHINKTAPEETKVANHKSAEKRNRQNKIRNARNTHIRTTMRSYIKKIRIAIADGDMDTAKTVLEKAIPYIDKAASKGVIHKATASRKISRLAKLINTEVSA